MKPFQWESQGQETFAGDWEGKGITLVREETWWENRGVQRSVPITMPAAPRPHQQLVQQPSWARATLLGHFQEKLDAIGSGSAGLFPLNQCWSCQAPHSGTYHRRC